MLEPQSAGYEFIKYRPEYRSQVLELQTQMWSPDSKTNAAYLDWKYSGNPYSASPIIYLALHKGQVVGTRAMFDTWWEGGKPSQLMHCLSDADAIIRPEHRRRGLLEKMTAMALTDLANSDRYEYVITLSANQQSAAHNLKLGWQKVGSPQLAFRSAQQEEASRLRKVARGLPILPSVYRRLRSYADGGASPDSARRPPFIALDSADSRTRQGTATHIRVEKTPHPKPMAELIERIGTDGRIRHVRDQKFFTWRFQNPLSEYRFLFWEEDRLEGYLVLQVPAYPDGDTWVTIVDCEATSTQIQADLLRTAIQRGHFDVLTIWAATLPDEAKGVLRANGFRLLDEDKNSAQATYQPILLVRPILSEKLDLDWVFADRRLLDISCWDLRAIYSDNF